MATDVPMPKLGLTMEEATILEWLVPEGTAVEADTPILLIETDKTETEVGAPGAGVLHQIGGVGEIFPCGERIGLLLADGEMPPQAAAPAPAAPAASAPQASPASPIATASASAPSAVDGRLLSSPNARRVAGDLGVDLRTVVGSGPGGRIVAADVDDPARRVVAPAAAPSTLAMPLPVPGVPVPASVAARQLADLLAIDLAQVPLDPVEGRVTRNGVALHVRSVLAAASGATPAPPSATASPPAAPGTSAARTSAWPLLQEPIETIPLRAMRGTIAKRMHESLQTMAQLTLSMDADVDALLADRAARKDTAGGRPVPSITDYVVKATAIALQRHPRLNAQVTDAGIAVLGEVHVGLAVAVDNGLLVPVIHQTPELSLDDLGAESRRLAGAARDGALGPSDLEGGTFSVSTLGMFGVDMFTPVINPPNAGILGVGRLRDELRLADGEVRSTKVMTLSLTWDHRVVDGAPAAEFCREIVGLLATPDLLA